MPLVVATLIRYIIIWGIQMGLWSLIEKYGLPIIEEAIVQIAKLGGNSREDSEAILRTSIFKAIEAFGINVAILKSKLPVKVADKLGFTSKGYGKPQLSAAAAATAIKIGFIDLSKLAPVVAANGPAGEAAASAFGVSWGVVKNIGKVFGGLLNTTFLGFLVISNLIDFGNWTTGAYSDTFQKIFAFVTLGLLKPNEEYRTTKTVSVEVFDKVYNAYKLQGAIQIKDPYKQQTVEFTRNNLIDLLDKVGANLLNAAGTAPTKDVIKYSQFMIVFGTPPATPSPAGSSAPKTTTGASAPQATPAAPTIQVFTGILSQGTLGLANEFVPRTTDLINSMDALKAAAQNNLASYLTSLPGRLIYEIKLVSSIINRDGIRVNGAKSTIVSGYKKDGTATYKTVINKFAVLDIYFLTKNKTRSKIETITLGPTDAVALNPNNAQLAATAGGLTASIATTDTTAITSIAPSIPDIVAQSAPKPFVGSPESMETASARFNAWYAEQRGVPGLVDIPAGLMEAYGGGPSENYVVWNGVLYSRDYPDLPSNAILKMRPQIPANLFVQGKPYKFSASPTIYIYDQGSFRGVATGAAFARFYGRVWDGVTDLNNIEKINTMPDLSAYEIPNGYFAGPLIE